MSAFRDRIKELRRVKAADLIANEKNFREHDRRQEDAMIELLSEIGYADALVAYETTDGLKLINGHMRKGLTPDQEVPVLVLDVTEEEADKLLATFDPVSSFATTNKEKLSELLKTLTINSHDMRAALTNMATKPAEGENATMKEKIAQQQQDQILEMELRPLEHYDYVLVMCRNVLDWNRLVELFSLEKTRKPTSSQTGICRAIDARTLLEKIDEMETATTKPAPAKKKKGSEDAA